MNLSDLSDLCSILSLVISAVATYKVFKIDQKISLKGNNNKGLNQNIKGSGNTQIGKQ